MVARNRWKIFATVAASRKSQPMIGRVRRVEKPSDKGGSGGSALLISHRARS